MEQHADGNAAAPHASDAAIDSALLGHVSTIMLALDDAKLPPLQRLKLSRELLAIRSDLAASPTPLQRLKLARRLLDVRRSLGAAVAPVQTPGDAPVDPVPDTPETQADAIAEGRATRISTSHLYDYDPNRKPAQRKRDNAQAMAILARINEGTLSAADLTDEEKAALAKYSGTGGNLVGADGKKGSAYEYYTPKPIAEGMWNLLRELGFSGGRTLDPCAAVGVFGATAPVNAAVDAVELNETSGRVNQLVNDGPGYSTTIAPFEQVAAATPDETYDAVITNVPFGDVNSRGGNQFKDEKYRNEPIQNYFILRSLEKLRPGGLAAFITPPRCVSGKGGKEQDLRERVSYMAEFVGAYRLPNSVFGTAAADTMTDVIVFRKYSREVLDKIAELREQAPATLVEANVLWQEFINGTYFVGDGARNILGTMARAKGRFGDVDVLNSDLSMTDIAKLMRKFPGSRVNWAMLDATETSPIVYRDGDTLAHAGNTLQMVDGRWQVLKSAGSEEAAAALAEQLAKLTTPLGTVNAGIAWREAERVQQAMVDSAQALDVPDWLRGLVTQLHKVDPGSREATWNAAIVGMAVAQALEERQAEETGFDYLNGYPILSEAMKRVAADAKKPPAMLDARTKTAMKSIGVHYSKSNGFSGVWRGDVAAAIDTRDDAQKFEAERYQSGGGAFVPMDRARQVYGEGFDPMGDDSWCLSADGQSVAKADDYYVGNYADFLARINADLAACTDDGVRQKLLRQKLNAEARLLRTDVSTMQFTLFSPFTKMEERAEFLRRFVDPRFAVGFDEDTGKPIIMFELVGAPKNERDKLLKRLALYMNGTRLTLGGIDVADEKRSIAALRNLAQTAESQFNSWVKANPVIMGRLADVVNDPARIYFRQAEDESPLMIPGLKESWQVHGYQNAWIRKTGREFAGINGDGVGLGKTSQGLIAVQHAQSIGVNRKTMFVLPNSVLSNWRKEAARVYESTDDCLYVGLRADKAGRMKADPSSYDADLTRILENRHRKIFCTYEAFQRLRMREATAMQYDAYLASVDRTYADSDSKAKSEKTKSLRAKVIEQLTSDASKSMAAPFFEDLGIDSLVIDEGHLLKNSRGTVDFGGGKFLSLAEPSARGLDAQAKAWFIRKDRPRKDGVILLTATPITNSPLEIYSMLSLAVGDAKLNDLMAGVKGADEFMEVMCQLENRDEETLDGLQKPYDVFTGLNNVGVLRNALAATVTARTAADVGAQIVMPDAEEKAHSVVLPKAVFDMLVEYKNAYRFAIDTINKKNEIRGDQAAYERVAAKFGEPMDLIGHPFNLIQKMGMLIADPELDQRATFYTISPAQADKAAELVDAWNTKAPVEDRARMGPHTEKVAVVGTKTKKDGDDTIELLRIQVRAKVAGDRIIVDTMDAQVQAAFEAMADKMGLDFDVTVPPKLAALVENFQHEEANPRGLVNGLPSGRVRQLIFCDNLAQHAKIKRLLMKRCGVSAASIAIITGKVNGAPEDILAVQDGFNAEGEENRFRVVIANEKAEVGINLQKGTQAIHHLTLGWTPDSLTQRNGRGLRQGNETQRVRIYQYDADGTFDSYKRMLVGKKANWIDNVMDANGGDSVAITGGMSNAQLETLIDTIGSGEAGGMSRVMADAEAKERLEREASTQGKQAVNVQTIKAQREFLARFPDAKAWAAEKVAAYLTLRNQATLLQDRISNPKATASALLKNQNLLAELDARIKGLRRMLDEAVVVKRKVGYDNSQLQPSSLDEFIRYVQTHGFYGELKKLATSARAAALIRKPSESNYVFEVSEAGAIGNEWRSEVDMATSMIAASQKDFATLAARDGGISPQVLAKVDTDEAVVIDGKVVCVGAFIDRGDSLAVVRKDQSLGLVAQYLEPDFKTRTVSAADEIRKAALVLPGSPGYDAMVTRAAKIEDALAAQGSIEANNAVFLFSSVVPEVAQRRTQQLLVRYCGRGWGSYQLPAPFFPYVVPQSDNPAGVRVVAKIAQQQAKVVTSTEKQSYLYFMCDSTVAVEKNDDNSKTFFKAVVEFARANSLKLTQDDFIVLNEGQHQSLGQALLNPGRTNVREAVVAGATTPDQIMERLGVWMVEQAFVDYDLSTDSNYAADPAGFLRTADFSSGYEVKAAIDKLNAAAARAAAAAQLAAQGVTMPAVPAAPAAPEPLPAEAPAVDTSDGNRIVGITGNTRRWKDQIKAAASAVGGRAIWDGAAERWNVPALAWLRLLSINPEAGNELQMVESSGKLSYGRRGR